MSKIRTRFAPSPTGRMHVGNLRTALYAYLIAKHEGGDFILRIEDTDQVRQVEGAVDIINRTLEETGLFHDEGPDKDGGCGPYVQSERVAQGIYMKYAKELIDKGEAYYCFCDKERLDSLKTTVAGKEISIYDKHCLHLSKEEIEANLAAGKPYVIRQNNPTEGTTTFEDEIYGDITVDNAELDDMILIKSDGYPTYNFANVVDDHLMGITHVVRGNEYLSSSPKYNRLYEAFGWDVPVYVHCPLITDEEHHKLSKRCGHSSFEDLLDQGFLTEAIVNFVALLGWSPSDNQEIMSLPELVEKFDYHHMSKSPAVFDFTKLKWMNGEYSPSGKLTVTFYQGTENLPEFTDYSMAHRTYRYTNENVLYPFGYGLHYGETNYDGMSVDKAESDVNEPVEVFVNVTNDSRYTVNEIVQLYIRHVDAAEYEPGYQLKGIEVVKLEPYETKKVKLTLSPRDFAVIEEDGSCVAVPGIYEISAGGQQPDDRSTKLTGKRTERIDITRCGEKTGVDY